MISVYFNMILEYGKYAYKWDCILWYKTILYTGMVYKT